MPEGKLLGRVVLTCPGKMEILELPRGAPVAELLSKAADLFGRGRFTDRAFHVVTPQDSKLDGGFYTWSPAGATDPGWLYVCRKRGSRRPRVLEFANYIVPDVDGWVFIDRTKLGDWGTKGKPVPLEAIGWWGTIKEFIAPPALSPQPRGVRMGQERSTAVQMY
ncbi:hypothetical protein COCOBI_04-1390 [Coccomyxa sp. Obi]|nr:hypothetical protein COCOBI_04-1390 [Coccomyxa sp. Obi]